MRICGSQSLNKSVTQRATKLQKKSRCAKNSFDFNRCFPWIDYINRNIHDFAPQTVAKPEMFGKSSFRRIQLYKNQCLIVFKYLLLRELDGGAAFP